MLDHWQRICRAAAARRFQALSFAYMESLIPRKARGAISQEQSDHFKRVEDESNMADLGPGPPCFHPQRSSARLEAHACSLGLPCISNTLNLCSIAPLPLPILFDAQTGQAPGLVTGGGGLRQCVVCQMTMAPPLCFGMLLESSTVHPRILNFDCETFLSKF